MPPNNPVGSARYCCVPVLRIRKLWVITSQSIRARLLNTKFGGFSSGGWLKESRCNILVKELEAEHHGGSRKVKDPVLQSLTL